MLNKIEELWNRLPKEIKVGIYYAGSIALTDIAAWVSGSQTVDLNIVARLFVANIILVFVRELKPRIESIRQ